MMMSASSHPEFAAASAPDAVPPPRQIDVSTTMIYTHVLNRGAGGVRSPLDPARG
jgi:hypothetical protein